MSGITGNAIVAQSGGPTTVINASACGVIQEALKNSSAITGVYGARNGILGVLQEDLFDIGAESPETIDALRRTPAAAIGSCRYKVKKQEDYERIIEVCKAHNVRYFFYAGGNDSMDTADKVGRLAADMNYDMICMGVPKTIDNDLAETDHCPGYGSVAKYNATIVMESGKDTEALYTHDTVTVVEVMGRNAGWIAAGCGVAQRSPEDAPHLIYVPEIPVTVEKVADDVRQCLKDIGRCVIVCGEGVKNEKGEYLGEAGGSFGVDAFGHKQLGGASDAIRAIVENEVGVKCRTNRMGTAQRNGMHFASLTDVNEAYLAGQTAVQEALKGTNRKMVTLVRTNEGGKYGCTTGLADLSAVANGEHFLPREFMNESGNHITDAMREYITPLLQGEAPITIGPDGLPLYMRFARKAVEKKTQRDYKTD